MTATLGPATMPPLTDTERGAFERDGFLVLPGVFDRGTCKSLIARANALVEQAPMEQLASVFSTRNQAHTTDDYFLSSGDKVAFFLEEEAVDADGRLTRPKNLAINKIGHALHDLDPPFAEFSRRPELAAIAHALGMRDPLLLQSMYIFKQPQIGGEVVLHQDATFLYTEPVSVMGLWVALQDATIENGCMWGLPGGHRLGLKRRMRRAGKGVAFDQIDATPIPTDGEIPLEAPQGTVIVLHGLFPHRSGANRSAKSRHAYSLHVIEADALYPDDNWLRRAADFPARGFA